MNTPQTRQRPPAPRFKWWQAALIFAAANAVSVLPAGFNGDEAFYNNFRKPRISPPDWLFPPMWLFLNVASLAALSRIANAPELTRKHKEFIVLEGAGWVLFAAFNSLYFGLRSPVMGAADTVAGLAVGGLSLAAATRLDRRAAWLILPRVLWLALASYVSLRVAQDNADPFLEGRKAGPARQD